jgi:hypothetical protein
VTEFASTVCGIPCIVRVTDWEAYVPAQTSGPPERCYPSEGGEGNWEILDRRGRPAAWLERKLTGDDRERIDTEVFNRMENLDDDN